MRKDGQDKMSMDEKKEWTTKQRLSEDVQREDKYARHAQRVLKGETYDDLLKRLKRVRDAYMEEVAEKDNYLKLAEKIESHFNVEYWEKADRDQESKDKLLNHLLDSQLEFYLNKKYGTTKEEYYKLKKELGIKWGDNGETSGGGKKSKRKKSKRKSKRKKSKRKKSKRKSKRKKSRKRR